MNPAGFPLRVGIVADLVEEGWPSMDLIAEMLMRHLPAVAPDLQVALLRPPLAPRLTRLPAALSPRRAGIVDRVLNRFWDYPRWLSRVGSEHDVFHIVDHSYAHLVHALPASRTVVTCHDIDAFLPLVAPQRVAGGLPRVLTRRIFDGLKKAGGIACPTVATRDALNSNGLLPAERLVIVPYGVDTTFSPHPDEHHDAAIRELLGPGGSTIELLHVGSTIPRKRIDLLLRIVAAVRAVSPDVRLVKIGGDFTAVQQAQIESLSLANHVVHLPFLATPSLAALYRRATMVLMPSEREGFGLPVAEALACGTTVIATDLPVLREVGGTAAEFVPLGDISAWRDAVVRVFLEQRSPDDLARRSALRQAQASGFTWDAYARSMAALYRERASGCRPAVAANATWLTLP